MRTISSQRRARARIREIGAAHAALVDAIRLAEQAAGVLEPREALDREIEISAKLVHEIATLPARTLEGLAAKARTALGRTRKITAEPIADEDPYVLSILHDVERLGAGDATASKRSAE